MIARQRQHVLEILQIRDEGMQIAFKGGFPAFGQGEQIVPARPRAAPDRKIATTASGPAPAPTRRYGRNGWMRETDGRSARAGIRSRESGRARSDPASVRVARDCRRTAW